MQLHLKIRKLSLSVIAFVLGGCGGGGGSESGSAGSVSSTPTYQVTTSIGSGGTLSPTSATVTSGSTTQIQVIPSTGYGLASISGCSGSLSGNVFTTAPISAACVVTATFQLKSYTVTANAGANGTVSATSATVTHGNITSFTFTPSAKYKIESVTGCNGSLNGQIYTTGPITGACTVTGTFSHIIPCAQIETSGGLTACVNQATLDGSTFNYKLGPASGSIDLDGDGRDDLILSSNYTTTFNTTTSADFFKYSSDGVNFTTMSPTIVGGNASTLFLRSVLVGDFNNDGLKDFALADGTEFKDGTHVSGGNILFNGTTQYAYLQKTDKSFQKVDLGVGDKTWHGAGVANPATDGFALFLNTPWNDPAVATNLANTVSFSGYAPTTRKYNLDPPRFTGASWVTLADVNGDGITDVIMHSQSYLNNVVLLNDGQGNLTYTATVPSTFASSKIDGSGNSLLQIENSAVLDLNGDGKLDFVALYIDRSDSSVPAPKSHLRVFLNNGDNTFTDVTDIWLGSRYQDYLGGYYDFFAVDVNADGRKDIVFTTNPSNSSNNAQLTVLKNTGSAFTEINFNILKWYEQRPSDQWMPGSVVVLRVDGGVRYLIAKSGAIYNVLLE
jgi:hypothetical protein